MCHFWKFKGQMRQRHLINTINATWKQMAPSKISCGNVTTDIIQVRPVLLSDGWRVVAMCHEVHYLDPKVNRVFNQPFQYKISNGWPNTE